MPTILRVRGYRFFFFSRENGEPAHIHVESGDDYAKFWIHPVVVAESYGFNATEIRRIRVMAEESSELLLEKWRERFGNR